LKILKNCTSNLNEVSQPHYNLAVLCEEQGLIDQAMEHYERAIDSASTHFQAQFNLGRIYGHRGDVDRQQQLYEAAIESNPEFVRGHYFLAKLIMDRGENLDRVEELALQGIEKDPEYRAGPMGHYLLADVYNRQGREAESQRELRRAQQIQAESSATTGR
jgi:tetratricopeptide (TPR) repeat protein